MKECLPTPSPSTTDLKPSPAQMVPGIPNPTTGCDRFAKLKIKWRAWWLGNIDIEHEYRWRR
jgi:hypothetical protein